MNYYKIGIKLLGLYFIVTGISMFPSMLILAARSPGSFPLFYVTSLLMPVLTILAGFFLYLKTDLIFNYSQIGFNKGNLTEEKFCVSSAIQLLGIYFVIAHLGNAIVETTLIVLSPPRYEKTLADTDFYKDLFIAFLGLSVIFKAKAMAKYINETTQ